MVSCAGVVASVVSAVVCVVVVSGAVVVVTAVVAVVVVSGDFSLTVVVVTAALEELSDSGEPEQAVMPVISIIPLSNAAIIRLFIKILLP